LGTGFCHWLKLFSSKVRRSRIRIVLFRLRLANVLSSTAPAEILQLLDE
jgi:hypothetical protein